MHARMGVLFPSPLSEEFTMEHHEQLRLNQLYAQHLQALKLQGKRSKRWPSPARREAKVKPDHHGGGSGVWHCSADSQLSPLEGSTELSCRRRIMRRASGSLISRCLGTGCETPVAGLRYQSCLPPCRTRTHPPCSINLIRSARFMA
jgi:hypothetical protein